MAYFIHFKCTDCFALSHLISFSLIVWCCSWSWLIVLSYVNLQQLTLCDFVLFHLKGSCQSIHHGFPYGTWWPSTWSTAFGSIKNTTVYTTIYMYGGTGLEYHPWGFGGVLNCSPGTYKIAVLPLIDHHIFCLLFIRLHVPAHPHPSSPTPSSSSCLQGPCYGI